METLWLGAWIAIRLVNAGQIPGDTLRRAEATAARIFARAGVTVEWVDCSRRECPAIPGVWVQFLGQKSRAAGYSVLYPSPGGTDGYAVVRYPVIAAVARDLDSDPAPLLGATIAHEIGHVLLGKAHTGSGVMMPRFNRREIQAAARGELGFSEKEAQRLRQMLPTVAAR
jgi:hypothetical protein